MLGNTIEQDLGVYRLGQIIGDTGGTRCHAQLGATIGSQQHNRQLSTDRRANAATYRKTIDVWQT
ncbi:hypothetical protein HC891_06770 [Candidatus Gracilibacteria bacterium]|nr:hypothetical protein [Candidatus Gracilibacteria bacterium]